MRYVPLFLEIIQAFRPTRRKTVHRLEPQPSNIVMIHRSSFLERAGTYLGASKKNTAAVATDSKTTAAAGTHKAGVVYGEREGG